MPAWFEVCDVKPDAYIDVIQLCPARGLGDEVDHFAQVTHVDAPLVHGLSQGGPVHWQHRVIQAVLDLQGMYRLWLLRTNMEERTSIKKKTTNPHREAGQAFPDATADTSIPGAEGHPKSRH